MSDIKQPGCKSISAPGLTVFTCDRGTTSKVYCESCKVNQAKYRCDFPLKGKKEGCNCDRPLCESCTTLKVDQHYCRPHANLVDKEVKF